MKRFQALLLAHLVASYGFWVVTAVAPRLIDRRNPPVIDHLLEWPVLAAPVFLPYALVTMTATWAFSQGAWPPHTTLLGVWIAYAVPLSLAFWWFDRTRRLVVRRRRAGLCPGCGYDVRATPDRCPECGTTVEVST